jgi:hypothetical protein
MKRSSSRIQLSALNRQQSLLRLLRWQCPLDILSENEIYLAADRWRDLPRLALRGISPGFGRRWIKSLTEMPVRELTLSARLGVIPPYLIRLAR